MLRSKKVITVCLAVCILMGLLAMPQSLASERYYLLLSDDSATYSLDSKTLKYSKDGTWLYMDAWVKLDYTAKGVQEKIRRRQKHNLPTTGFSELKSGFWHDLYAYSPSRNKMMIMTYGSVYYSHDGTVLDTYDDQKPEWKDVVPGSLGEALLEEIYVYCQKNLYPTPR